MRGNPQWQYWRKTSHFSILSMESTVKYKLEHNFLCQNKKRYQHRHLADTPTLLNTLITTPHTTILIFKCPVSTPSIQLLHKHLLSSDRPPHHSCGQPKGLTSSGRQTKNGFINYHFIKSKILIEISNFNFILTYIAISFPFYKHYCSRYRNRPFISWQCKNPDSNWISKFDLGGLGAYATKCLSGFLL